MKMRRTLFRAYQFPGSVCCHEFCSELSVILQASNALKCNLMLSVAPYNNNCIGAAHKKELVAYYVQTSYYSCSDKLVHVVCML